MYEHRLNNLQCVLISFSEDVGSLTLSLQNIFDFSSSEQVTHSIDVMLCVIIKAIIMW